MLRANKELHDFAQNCHTVIPINIRDSFYGGRVSPVRLYHDVQPGEKIRYMDVTSLYPFITLTGSYPVTHPVIIGDSDEIDRILESYYGLVKLTILPPREPYIPFYP